MAITREKRHFVDKIYDYVMSSAKRKRNDKTEIKRDDGEWVVLEDMPIKKLRELAHSITGTEMHESPHGRHSERHLCRHCGTALEQHKGGTDWAGKVGTCPSTIAWGMMKKFPTFGNKSDETIDRELERYWDTGSTFNPVR